eukprot:s5656_g7.t1
MDEGGCTVRAHLVGGRVAALLARRSGSFTQEFIPTSGPEQLDTAVELGWWNAGLAGGAIREHAGRKNKQLPAAHFVFGAGKAGGPTQWGAEARQGRDEEGAEGWKWFGAHVHAPSGCWVGPQRAPLRVEALAAGVVDALDEVWHVVRVRRRSLGGAGERGNEELRSDWRGSCEELASALPPVRRTRVGPPGFKRCGCKVGSCSMQERHVEPGVRGIADFARRWTQGQPKATDWAKGEACRRGWQVRHGYLIGRLHGRQGWHV